MSENQTETPVADTLNDERARRLADREALYAAGQNPYPEHSDVEDYVADIVAFDRVFDRKCFMPILPMARTQPTS